MTKTYQSIGMQNRSINIRVGGKIRAISFTGGRSYPTVFCGLYTTSDPKEQLGIERHKGYGSKFKLISEVGTVAKKEPITILEAAQELTTEASHETENAPIVEAKVKTEEVEPQMTGKENISSFPDKIEAKPKPQNVEVTTEKAPEVVIKTNEVFSKKVNKVPTEKIVEVFEVEKVQQARDYLMDKYPNEFTHKNLSNKVKILAAAKEKLISFPNIT